MTGLVPSEQQHIISFSRFIHPFMIEPPCRPVYRAWKNRVKGRDWYDFEWYVRHNVPLDFTHLCERALQFNHEEPDKETFLQKLNERLATADMNQIKADVLPFVRNPKELDIWSNDYFMELAKMIRFE